MRALAALKATPDGAESLYGRGISNLRPQKTREGQADIAAALAANKDVATEFEGSV